MRPSRLAPLALLAMLLGVPELSAGPGKGTMLGAEDAVAWRGVGRVNIGGVRSRSLCTGTLIAPDVVLTAAHCVVHQDTGKPHALGMIHFVAGWNGGEMSGHSTASAVSVHPFYRPGSEKSSLMSDLALIRLRSPMPPEAAKPFVIAAPPPPGSPILVVSYRRDRAHALTYQDDCVFGAREGPMLILECPVASGASGAPVLAEIDGEKQVIATLVAMTDTGLAFAIQAKGPTDELLAHLDDPGSAPVSH
jgi:V8-like Glu-specific endopeptidase